MVAMTAIKKKSFSIKKAKSLKIIPSTKLKIKEFIPMSLPSGNDELCKYIANNKVKLMEAVISSVEYAIKNNIHMAEVFTFDNNEFLITISRAHFKQNIEKIYNLYIQNEYYELCPRVSKLIQILNENKKVG